LHLHQPTYAPASPILLAVLATAQIGVHPAFFVPISSAPDQTNNFLALAFSIFTVGLIVFGRRSSWLISTTR
jgi:cytochrome o ubiquinol oxidase operon protein cyoD